MDASKLLRSPATEVSEDCIVRPTQLRQPVSRGSPNREAVRRLLPREEERPVVAVEVETFRREILLPF